MAEWELSKENVQPLKQGRKVSTLNSVLHAKEKKYIIIRLSITYNIINYTNVVHT